MTAPHALKIQTSSDPFRVDLRYLAGNNRGRVFSFPLVSAVRGYILFFLFFFFCLFRAASAAYEGTQARGPIGAAAAGLLHSRSNMGSEPHL